MKDVSSIAIRPATLADSDQIAQLVTDLGYSTSAAQMRKRLEALFCHEDYETMVACEGERVVGLIGSRIGPMYESDHLFGQIMALVVATDRQRRGVGQRLLAAAELNLVERGVRVLVVNSGNHRSDAHAFYEKNGYTLTGRRFTRPSVSSV